VVSGAISKVSVNRHRCKGHARCVALAPDVFEVDELGGGRVIGNGMVWSDLRDKAYLAKPNCPESAIDVEEGD
jgi:ferredoxin